MPGPQNQEPTRPVAPVEPASLSTSYFEQQYLYAFATQQEVTQYVRTQAIPSEAQRLPEILADWTALRPRVAELVSVEGGLAESSIVTPVPDQCAAQLQEYVDNPQFRASFSSLPSTFGVVPIDTLIAPQRTVHREYVARLAAQFTKAPDLETLLKFCVAPTRAMDPIQHLEVGANAHVFSSPNSDIRFLGAFLKGLTPEDWAYAVHGGIPVAAIVAFVGYGSPSVNVFRVGGRLVLNNGFHRLFALRSIGVTHAPVVVQDVANSALEFPAQVSGLPKEYLLQVPRPVLMKDFFESDFAISLKVKNRIKSVTIQVQVGQHDVPA
jgi:hypothetical protein